MNWPALHAKLLAHFSSDPQRAAKAEHALREAEHGLDALAALGWRFWLTDEPPMEDLQWPRLVYHIERAPHGRVVRCQADLDELGQGWHDTPQAARLAAGLAAQFLGRGGVRRVMLPAIIYPIELTPLDRERLASASNG